MDWFTWLSKTGLDPSLVYHYGLIFSHNELEEADTAYFNHEFLQSMGVSIAKHRLEILKLAQKYNGSIAHPMSKILIAIKRTKNRFSKYLRTWIRCEESALAIVPAGSYSTGRKNSMIKKNKRLLLANNQQQNRAPLLLTNGSPVMFPSSRINSFSSPAVFEFQRDDQKLDEEYDHYWPSVVEDIRWDSMFQNLKPT
ncbi:uncharacterized protein LOC127243582 [Andrographis paniculata]|uniref:uncharacterized protein LOC127243582 n=1 Tax=Andrographis paniculata TaxID=175694 RepID=UPI0021E94207|nr:uncharacterized protein LOC127243582 [Andrographis paniculata]